MTFTDIERKARRILQDNDAPYRWDSSELREHLQEGIYAIHALRPETRYVNGTLVDAVMLQQNDDEEWECQINARFEEALVYFVVHKCYLDDDTDTTNQQLAEIYLGKFNTKAQL